MKSIEINGGSKIGFEELLQGASKLDVPNLEELSQKLMQLIQRKKLPEGKRKEIELIKIIYSKLSAKTQNRYDELFEKRRAETLSKLEHQELTELIEVAEKHQVVWLKALVDLAKLRGVSIEEVKKQLGLPEYPTVDES